MPIIIGLTAGEIYNKKYPWAPVTYGQAHTYSDSIIRAGGVPLILPMTSDLTSLRAMYEEVSGIVFAGGNDVNPELYGEKPIKATVEVSKFRDAYEKQLMQWAIEDKKPIFAICRGMQLINVVCGGSLYQDIPTYLPTTEDHQDSTNAGDITHIAHEIKLAPNSKLTSILSSKTIKTNTHHHQAVKQIASNLKAVGWSDDGIVEALESKDDSFVIGVQSHPESLTSNTDLAWIKLFEAFIAASGKYS
jgi:putative glutamine amidotransferase